MAEDRGIFSDDDLDVGGNNGTGEPPSNSDTTSSPRVFRRKAGKLPKIITITRLQDTEQNRGRSRSPTPSNSYVEQTGRAGTPMSSYPTRNGFPNSTNESRKSAQMHSLVPAAIRQSTPVRHLEPNRLEIYFVFAATIFTILWIGYALHSYHAAINEIREALNTHQMHLINLHNQNRLEGKEAVEREKRFIASLGKLESRFQELTRAVRPNYIEGIQVIPQSSLFSITPVQKRRILESFLEELGNEHHNQPKETYIQLLSVIGETIREEDPRPAGIVLLVPPDLKSKAFPNCFALKLAREINRIWSGMTYQVNPKELSQFDVLDSPDVSNIHADLKSYFNYEGGKAVIVHDLEQIQSHEMLMMFHAFCDNVMAYDPQATFIFTLNVPKSLYEKYTWIESNSYRLVYETLMSSWVNVLTPDKTSALISRIALASILLRDGDTC